MTPESVPPTEPSSAPATAAAWPELPEPPPNTTECDMVWHEGAWRVWCEIDLAGPCKGCPNNVTGQRGAVPTARAASSRLSVSGRATAAGWMDPRWFAEDFVNLYEQVKNTDPDIREEFGKWAHNARVWLANPPPEQRRYIGVGAPSARRTLYCVPCEALVHDQRAHNDWHDEKVGARCHRRPLWRLLTGRRR